MEEEPFEINKKKQDIIAAMITGIIIVGGGVLTGMIWLIILSIIRS